MNDRDQICNDCDQKVENRMKGKASQMDAMMATAAFCLLIVAF
jgi:hypothetical protein